MVPEGKHQHEGDDQQECPASNSNDDYVRVALLLGLVVASVGGRNRSRRSRNPSVGRNVGPTVVAERLIRLDRDLAKRTVHDSINDMRL